jgi:hypothetical protein
VNVNWDWWSFGMGFAAALVLENAVWFVFVRDRERRNGK